MTNRRPSRVKRLLARAIVCFALGPITTVLFPIWFISNSPWSQHQSLFASNLADRNVTVAPRWEAFNDFRRWRSPCFEVIYAVIAFTSTGSPGDPFPEDETVPPKWVRDHVDPSAFSSIPSGKTRVTYSIARSGWPLYCFVGNGHLGLTAIDAETSHGALPLSTLSKRAPFIQDAPGRFIPLTPMPPPFAANAVFFGSVWFAVSYLPMIIPFTRRAVRRNRGHCPKCAYDLQADFDTGCPECGWNRTAISSFAENAV